MATMSTPDRRAIVPEARTPSSSLSVSRSPNVMFSPSSSRQLSSTNMAPLTVESALSNANGDISLALEQVVSERNTLSSQNMQLWRLIEKQRSAHSNVLKELERVRGERDKLLSRVDPERVAKKSHASKGASVQVADDGIVSSHSADSPSDVVNGHRVPVVKQQSEEDVKISRRSSVTSVPNLSGSRSHEPLRPQNRVSPPASASVDSLVVPVTNGSTFTLEPVRETQVQATAPVSTTSAPSGSTMPPAAPAPTTAPPPIPTSSPIQVNSSESPVNMVSAISTAPGTQPLQINKSRTLPTLAPSELVLSEHSRSESAQRQVSLPPSGAVEPSSLLNLPVPGHNRSAARESRISLPAEASRYIASMQESPIPSPSSRQAAFTATTSGELKPMQEAPEESKPSGGFITPIRSHFPSQAPPPPSQDSIDDDANKSPFLEMEDDNDDDDDDDIIPETPLEERLQASSEASTTSSNANAEPDLPQPEQSQISPAGGDVTPQALKAPSNVSYSPPYNPQPPPMYTSPRERDMNLADLSYVTSSPMVGHDRTSPSTVRAQPSSAPIQAQIQAQRLTYAQTQVQMQAAHMSDLRPQQSFSNSQSLLQSLPEPQPSVTPPPYPGGHNNRARLTPDDLSYCRVYVIGSHIRPNDRGKEVLSFVMQVCPRGIPEGDDVWKVEKLYSDVLALDAKIRSLLSRSDIKKLGNLPDSKLFKDNAPAKVDQRKAILEAYMQGMVRAPIKDPRGICEFLNTDVMNEANAPVTQSGYKEGYLTKRGKNFGGWKTRYFVLQGPVLEYYESRGGAHLGSINITGAQIGRQQKSNTSKEMDDENEYRHAFLIIENKKAANAQSTRHVLCAESDQDRDVWVDVLVRYVMGTYDDTPAALALQSQSQPMAQPRPSTSSITSDLTPTPSKRNKPEIAKGPAVPISQLQQDQMNAKLFQSAPMPDSASSSPLERYPSPLAAERTLQSINEVPLSSSLPSSLDGGGSILTQRSVSELGHYPDMSVSHSMGHHQGYVDPRAGSSARKGRVSLHPSLATVPASSSLSTPIMVSERAPSPSLDTISPSDAQNKVKISGPMNGIPIPPGYKFGAREVPPSDSGSSSERDRKTKSRNFWGFGRSGGATTDKASLGNVNNGTLAASSGSRAVFGVPIVDSLAVAQIANLPAVVYRCIEYLEAKKAEQEEGIYRLSGSSAVIKSLKDRFNAEGDVNLLASDEFWDPHAIAGVLKSFLRELPTSVLTRDLHLKFLAVIDLADPKERVDELAQLVAQLPVPNYSLLRALTAHLILIVQNSATNKMTMRNVGIVFSPTLGIPAGVFSLMLGEFNHVFNVDGANDEDITNSDKDQVAKQAKQSAIQSNRNSRSYADAAADQMLGLSGRSLKKGEDSDSTDDVTIPDSASDQETEDADVTTTFTKSTGDLSSTAHGSDDGKLTPAPYQRGQAKASTVAASRGLQVKIDRRKSGAPGLPHSPRPAARNPTLSPPSTPQ